MTQKKTLKWATSSKVVHEPWQETAKRINERTDGEIDVEFYCLDIVSEKEVLSAVASGKADIGFTWSGTYGPGVLPHCNVSELPYWPSGKAGCAFTKAVVDKYVRSEMEALGVTPIVFEINSAFDFGHFTAPYLCHVWSKKKFVALKDAAGAKISAQLVISGEAVSAIGMIPKVMTYAEVKPALSANSIDGCLFPGIGPLFGHVDINVTPYCLKIGYPEAFDDFVIMNLKTYNSLPADIRNIVVEEVRNLIISPAMDRTPLTKQGWEHNEAMVKDGKLEIIELIPSDQAWCKQQWETKLADAWIRNQIAAGFIDAKAYVDELLQMRDSILASGLPQYPGPIL